MKQLRNELTSYESVRLEGRSVRLSAPYNICTDCDTYKKRTQVKNMFENI
jgi:hypothetical protein